MSIRTIAAALAAGATIAAVGIVTAPTASAAVAPNGCQALNEGVADGTYNTRVTEVLTWHAGDTITITTSNYVPPRAGTGSTEALFVLPATEAPGAAPRGPIGETWTYVVPEDLVAAANPALNALGEADWTLSCAPKAAAPMPAWIQSVGRASKDAACQDGWGASWESWAEPVTGGWVCTRSVPMYG